MMNTLESYHMENPENITDECAKVVIDNINSPFILSNIMTVGEYYTFSFWGKSDTDASIQIHDELLLTTDEWKKHSITFMAETASLFINFMNAGNYYIYQPKLETGNTATEWSLAPEDIATSDDIAKLSEDIYEVSSELSTFKLQAGSVYMSVASVEEKIRANSEGLNERIDLISNSVSSTMTKDAILHEIETQINTGVTKVDTKTGIKFDSDGMTIDKSGAETSTTISENGMTVYGKFDDNKKPVLIANNTGVDATDLRASTYLIIGGRSRFENFESNRTGCFWIGG